MSLLRSRLLCVALFLGAGASVAAADTIHLVDGTKLEGVQVREETLANVTYGKDSVPSERVLRVEFSKFPAAIQEAELLVAQGDVASALLQLADYIARNESGDRAAPWAPAWAAQRRVELSSSSNDLAGTVAAADALLAAFPDSRYVPQAYLAKAEAQIRRDERAAAVRTLGGLSKLADAERMSPRWRLIAEVESAAIDPSRPAEPRLAELDRLARAAGQEFPTVRDRALVAQGELLLALADQGTDADSNVEAARGMFEAALTSEALLDATRAGALVGLADCDFAQASPKSRVEGLVAARNNYLRVVVLHPDQARYAAKAMYMAGLCFRQLGDVQQDEQSKARAREMMRRVIREHDGTFWAGEARRYA